jgi:hypothetical protein
VHTPPSTPAFHAKVLLLTHRTPPAPTHPPTPRYEDLLRLNVEAYIAALEAKGEELSLAEVRWEGGKGWSAGRWQSCVEVAGGGRWQSCVEGRMACWPRCGRGWGRGGAWDVGTWFGEGRRGGEREGDVHAATAAHLGHMRTPQCLALCVAQVRSEIKRHALELEALTEALPQGMAVGLVFVNCAKVWHTWLACMHACVHACMRACTHARMHACAARGPVGRGPPLACALTTPMFHGHGHEHGRARTHEHMHTCAAVRP